METQEIIMVTIFLIILALGGRIVSIYGLNNTDYYCNYIFPNSSYEYEDYFGQSCVRPNYENHTLERVYFNYLNLEDYCDFPGFFELSRWGNNCNGN